MVSKVKLDLPLFQLNVCVRLIMNESLGVGSQFEYIDRARQLGYGVVVTNTNLNTDESPAASFSSPRRVRVSSKALMKSISAEMI